VLRAIATYVAEIAAGPADEFAAGHPYPFLVHTGAPLRPVDRVRTRGETINRLVLEGETTPPPTPMPTVMFVAPIVPRDPAESLVTIGLESTCDLAINDASLSKQHAWFDRVDGAWRIWDNDSAAGTQVNGEMLKPGYPRKLVSGDRITLGYVDMTFLDAAAFHAMVSAKLR
jgi:hypothetical protein